MPNEVSAFAAQPPRRPAVAAVSEEDGIRRLSPRSKRSLVVDPVLQIIQKAAVTLRRPPFQVRRWLCAPAPQVHAALALDAARFAFLIQFSCFFGRPALLGQVFDANAPVKRFSFDRNCITYSELPRRLDALAVYLDAPRGDRLLGAAARLEEARRPQPLVQTGHALARAPTGQDTPVPPRPQIGRA